MQIAEKLHQRMTVRNMSTIYHIFKACDVIFHLLLHNMYSTAYRITENRNIENGCGVNPC